MGRHKYVWSFRIYEISPALEEGYREGSGRSPGATDVNQHSKKSTAGGAMGVARKWPPRRRAKDQESHNLVTFY